MVKSFSYPQPLRAFIGVFSISVLIGLFLFLFATRQLGLDAIAGLSLILVLSLLVNLDLWRTQVSVDEEAIMYQALLGSVALKWSEIDDLHYSPRLIYLGSTRQRKRIKVFKGEYGFSLEPFEVLRNGILQRVGPHLERAWEQLGVPLTYPYPGLSPGTVLAYVVPLGLILTFFLLFAIKIEGLWFEKFLFLLIGVFILIPFFIRDYLTGRNALFVELAGLRKTNGKEQFIPWQGVTKIVVREPLSVGYGSIIIASEHGVLIKIPRSITNCGQILYVIRRKTGLLETYAQGY